MPRLTLQRSIYCLSAWRRNMVAGWWPCCCADGGCGEDCDDCTFTVTISGMNNGACTDCSNLNGSYAVSTLTPCSVGGGGSSGFETGDFRCAGDGGCGLTWLDTFSATLCSSTRNVYMKITICCDAIYVQMEAETGAISSDLYYWKLTKSEGDYPSCGISSLNIPFFSQSGPFPPGIGCSASSSTCTLTASC